MGLEGLLKATFCAQVTGNGSRLSCLVRNAFNSGCRGLLMEERLEPEG